MQVMCPVCGIRPARRKGIQCVTCYRRNRYATDSTYRLRRQQTGKALRVKYPERYKKQGEASKKRIYARNLEYFKSLRELKCEKCGYDKHFAAIECHHLNPTQKEGRHDTLSYWLWACSLKRFKEKVKSIKFQLLCANCHQILHYEEKGDMDAITT